MTTWTASLAKNPEGNVEIVLKRLHHTKEHIVLTNAGSSSRNTLADLHGNNTIDALTPRGRLLP